MSTNDGNNSAPSNKAPQFTLDNQANGQFTFVATLFNAKNDVTITAADSVDTAKKGTSNSFNVFPSAIHSVDVTPSAASVTAGGTVDLEAIAYDVYSNEVSTPSHGQWTRQLEEAYLQHQALKTPLSPLQQ